MKKNLIFILLSLMLLAPLTAAAFGGEHAGCSGDCKECHSLDKKEAADILKKLNPQLKVMDVKQAPVKSLWQIDVENEEGKHGPVFLDFSKKNLLIVNQIIPVEAIGKMPPPAPAKVDFSKIPLKNAIVLGPRNAAKKIVVISDPDCPFCRNLHAEMHKVLSQRKDVAFYLILYPLPIHKDSYKKVQTLLCSKSVDLVNQAFEGKSLPEPACSNKRVENNKALVEKLGIRTTPTLIRYDGTVETGALPAEQLSAWIDAK